MKKFTHPNTINTTIQLKDGSTYIKQWNFFRTTLALEIDVMTHPLWKKSEKHKLIKKNINLISKSTIKN